MLTTSVQLLTLNRYEGGSTTSEPSYQSSTTSWTSLKTSVTTMSLSTLQNPERTSVQTTGRSSSEGAPGTNVRMTKTDSSYPPLSGTYRPSSLTAQPGVASFTTGQEKRHHGEQPAICQAVLTPNMTEYIGSSQYRRRQRSRQRFLPLGMRMPCILSSKKESSPSCIPPHCNIGL